MTGRRVAITGVGLVSPLGVGNDENWRSLCAGKSGIGPITRFDASAMTTRFAGEVRDFDPTRWIPKKEVRQMDLFIQYAIAAAAMAVEDAKLGPPDDPERFGVYVGAGLGGLPFLESTHDSLREKGPRHGISPYFVPAIIVNLAPGQISIRHNYRGPNMSHVSACSTGAHSIGEAFHLIARGGADVMIAGGTEATVSPLAVGGFGSMRALSTRNDEPTKASRPFTLSRDGFVLSEGAGLLILEEWERAKARGARIYAEIVGYAATSDAHHITAPSPDGEGAQRCMRLALRDAGLPPEAVGYINAHGTSTGADATETGAIKAVFGEHARKLAVSSTKSMHGHLLGATGGLEAAICALALHHEVLPPTINLDDPDPECDLDYVPHEARKVAVDVALSNSFGFGGTNACLVFKRTG
ncbi:3-oxoacyl-[acyl-carrier-protein] synthase II [Nannocystis exedens]|uniref:3-oxoacyl-[acyl-carrier-protein] synthase 2 n=1 Tax=Nannocystis exedens TaxID=54 RepID=A0A1I2GAW6_9BACT|nr:beta-ketoacyl-ACP synthase II [Nannocystis exedens]PCC67435.1 beta-ketoacyl-[acyl-carrier-protein] synthase II [Nannocystis exedens]SFF14884.1 3-oxoacyl-[acyl-carrier-protein] synthase II [Nannocystis exedens]